MEKLNCTKCGADLMATGWAPGGLCISCAAAQIMGTKGGKSKSPVKQSAARENGKRGGRPSRGPWVVKVAYDCRLGTPGTIVSSHSTYKLARLKTRRTGYDSFLAVQFEED